jgi:hypothetical protein
MIGVPSTASSAPTRSAVGPSRAVTVTDHYERLERMEREAEREWAEKS